MGSLFDQSISRRDSDSQKWRTYPQDVLPMWVADMDFPSPQAVIDALQARAAHGIFGYPATTENADASTSTLREAVAEWVAARYDWSIHPEWLVFIPGVVTGFNLAAHTFAGPGGGLLIQTPVYHPFLNVSHNAGLEQQGMELTRGSDGKYLVDLEAFESTITPDTRLFLLSSPHNPIGRVFTRSELQSMAEICLRHGVPICSDEIHCDLLFDGRRHHPLAALDPEIARRTITLIAPSKTFNLAGLVCSFAIIPDAELRQRYLQAGKGLVSGVNLMGAVAAEAAYRHGLPWLEELLVYLQANRDTLQAFVESELPGIQMALPEATYLAWLDCRAANLPGGPYEFFLKEARVAVNDGAAFGQGGAGFVRLNFGCTRSTLQATLERMRSALLRHLGVG